MGDKYGGRLRNILAVRLPLLAGTSRHRSVLT
jgi:hypothetical protein